MEGREVRGSSWIPRYIGTSCPGLGERAFRRYSELIRVFIPTKALVALVGKKGAGPEERPEIFFAFAPDGYFPIRIVPFK